MTSHTVTVAEFAGKGGDSELDWGDAEIMKAYADVRNDATNTDWMLVTYAGNTNALKLAGSGNDGLSGLVDELSDGKIMYGFLRRKETKGTKFVFICWVGSGVPALRKGVVTKHCPQVESVLVGFHAVIQARSEDELTEKAVTTKLSRSSNY